MEHLNDSANVPLHNFDSEGLVDQSIEMPARACSEEAPDVSLVAGELTCVSFGGEVKPRSASVSDSIASASRLSRSRRGTISATGGLHSMAMQFGLQRSVTRIKEFEDNGK